MNLSQFEQFDLSPELLKALEKKGYSLLFYYLRYNIYWIIHAVNRAHRVFWY